MLCGFFILVDAMQRCRRQSRIIFDFPQRMKSFYCCAICPQHDHEAPKPATIA
jgi:hypothetical protein